MKTQEKVRSAVAHFGEGLSEKAWTIGRDPKAERRKRLAWGALQGAFGVLATVAARRTGARLWGVLTGERPPVER